MKKMVISRYLSKETYEAVKRDFCFLIEKLEPSGFEYGLQIRDNYLNLYYRGNSLGEIAYRKSKKLYKIRINHKFVEGIGSVIRRFKHSRKRTMLYLLLRVNNCILFLAQKICHQWHGRLKKFSFKRKSFLNRCF